MAVVTTLLESPQTYVEWRIENYFDLSKEINYFLDSSPFSLSDAKWILQIYPNGESRYGYNDSIALYLRRKYCGRQHNVHYEIGVKRSNGTHFKLSEATGTFGVSQNICGWNSFCQRSMLLSSRDSVAPDGVLTITCKAHVVDCIEATAQISSSDGKGTLSDNLHDLYISKLYTDVTILVENREFFAHKNILATRSSVFASMLEHDMVEKASGRVEIKDCDPESFDAFLYFLYTGKMDVVSPKNAINLYEIADKYHIMELKKECSLCIAQCNMSVDLFCDIVALATMHNDSELLNAATNFFINNAKPILLTTMWKTFLEANTSLGHRLFLNFVEKQENRKGKISDEHLEGAIYQEEAKKWYCE